MNSNVCAQCQSTYDEQLISCDVCKKTLCPACYGRAKVVYDKTRGHLKACDTCMTKTTNKIVEEHPFLG